MRFNIISPTPSSRTTLFLPHTLHTLAGAPNERCLQPTACCAKPGVICLCVSVDNYRTLYKLRCKLSSQGKRKVRHFGIDMDSLRYQRLRCYKQLMAFFCFSRYTLGSLACFYSELTIASRPFTLTGKTLIRYFIIQSIFLFLPVPLSYPNTLLPFLLNNKLVSFGWSFEHAAATCVYTKNATFPKKRNDIHTVANSLVFML